MSQPELVLEANRLNTFASWTGEGPSEQLAKAGFYFTGHADRVKCFLCNVTLEDWIEEDDPWIKHTEFSPNCLFAQLAKEEDNLTVIEWLQVMEQHALNRIGQPFIKLTKST